MSPARRLGRLPGEPRILIADDSGLMYSDDYRDGWEWGFRSLGCQVRVVDIAHMRRVVTSSSRTPYSRRTMQLGRMQAQDMLRWHPDLVWCHHGRAAAKHEWLQPFRAAGVPTAVYLCDEPYETGETAKYSPEFDFVFTMDPCTLATHRVGRSNPAGSVFYLPPGVNPDRFRPRAFLAKDISALFLGNASLEPRPDWLRPIERVVEGADIRFWSATTKSNPRWVSIDQYPQLYARARIGLNVHRAPEMTKACWQQRVVGRSARDPVAKGIDLAPEPPERWGTGHWNEGNLPAAHVNPRFFEMAACGTLVVSDDHRSELARMFPCAPRASSPEHFLELVLHFIAHQDQAIALARACRYLTLERHTYQHRAYEILVRTGLSVWLEESQFTSWAQQEDCLTPQDFDACGVHSSSAATGLSERWSPRRGMSWINRSGRASDTDSLDWIPPWLC